MINLIRETPAKGEHSRLNVVFLSVASRTCIEEDSYCVRDRVVFARASGKGLWC